MNFYNTYRVELTFQLVNTAATIVAETSTQQYIKVVVFLIVLFVYNIQYVTMCVQNMAVTMAYYC